MIKNKKDNLMIDEEFDFLKKNIRTVTKEIIFEMKDTKVPLYFIANRLNKDVELIRKAFLEIISEDGYYGKFSLEGDYIAYKLSQEKCYDCGHLLKSSIKSVKLVESNLKSVSCVIIESEKFQFFVLIVIHPPMRLILKLFYG